MKKLAILFLLLACLSCKTEKEPMFSFIGTTVNIKDGTIILLENTETRLILDSTTVEKNKFEFKRAIPKSPLQVVLRTKDYSNYKYVWIENKTMRFDAIESDFRNATITGSESENLNATLNNLTNKLDYGPERTQIEQTFVSDHPNSVVSANILAVYATTWGRQTTQDLFNKFSTENRNSANGRRISNFIRLNKEPKIGEPYVDFEMANQNGTHSKLSDIDGKIVLLEFWASWCGPCRNENPNLVKTYKNYKPQGFEVFAVSIDQDKESWLGAIKKDSLNWQHVSELNGSENTAGLIYGVNGIPDNFLINKNGIIVGRNLKGEKLNKKLEELIGNSTK